MLHIGDLIVLNVLGLISHVKHACTRECYVAEENEKPIRQKKIIWHIIRVYGIQSDRNVGHVKMNETDLGDLRKRAVIISRYGPNIVGYTVYRYSEFIRQQRKQIHKNNDWRNTVQQYNIVL